MILSSTVLLLLLALNPSAQTISREIHFRLNQLGYQPFENKIVVAFSETVVNEKFELVSADNGSVLLKIEPLKVETNAWGKFNYYIMDFTQVQASGSYFLRSAKSGFKSRTFHIAKDNYQGTTDDLLTFMRQQRCGYNPFLDMVCHQRDGRIFYGNLPDSTFVDVSGGWHDAGDQLKYLITGSYATAHMLMAYKLYPGKFSDKVNTLGQPFPNNVADVLDEAKWGLDWILKLHFAQDQLIHQIADDRDHLGWKMPDQDPSDFGWGPNSYRVAYVANGKPQGLNIYKSQSTGYANVAGRSAAALALGAQVWMEIDTSFAMQCRNAALSLYALGKTHEGYQQGNSYGAPYRYNEQTWADDMEWGAAELYRLTGSPEFLNDAKRYATEANTDNWLMLDSASHYQYYPFINMGHFALYDLVDEDFKSTLTGYYKKEIDNIARRAGTNPFGIGIPFLWCSNNLMTSFVTQALLYEKMTGDQTYYQLILQHRDWLFGKNPWGTSMFTGMPTNGEYPLDVHTSIWAKTKKVVPGGLIDGPIYKSINDNLLGLHLSEADEFQIFQNEIVVYHDDIGDYSTNEPTMDGTAGAMILMANWSPDIK